MTAPILTTKLYIPPPRQDLVPRPRLIEQLNTTLSKRLALVSAPAGFGKSTILGDWAAQSESQARIAWLSLDDRDNDLARFLTYFIAALQQVDAEIGSSLQAALQGPEEVNPEIILTNLLNEIAPLPDEMVLVLDDYHVIESPPIDQAVGFFLENLPPQFHLVISSRIDPTLPLHRLRARGQMTELRVDDLRFSPEEAADFLNHVMGFDFTGDDLAALSERTEGWIAGLQLAALSMKEREDIHEFIRSFTGSNRYILDYLGDEILAHQSKPIQEFLMRTSILNRLSAPLCDAVCFDNAPMQNGADSQDILENLEAANLFIVSLDHERQWYRYHHLFADLLQYQLKRSHANLLPVLHQRASDWFEQNNFAGEAVFHALASGEIERAADLIEANAMALITTGEVHTISNWLHQLPEDLIQSKPGLTLAQAWRFYINGQIDKTTQWLDILDAQLGITSESDLRKIKIADLPEKEIWEAMETIRSTIYAWQGKAKPAIEFSRWALDNISDRDQRNRAILEWNLAFASRLVGDVQASKSAYLRAIEAGHNAGNTLIVLNATVGIAQLYSLLGQLEKAKNAFREVFQLGDQYRMPYSVALGSAHIGLAKVMCQQNQLENAVEHFQQGLEIAEKWGKLDLVKAYVCQSQIKVAQADLDSALETIEKAIALAEEVGQDFRGGVARAFRTRLWLALGEDAAADAWAQNEFEYDSSDLSELNEIRGIVLARVWLKQAKLIPASELLAQLYENAETIQRLGHMVEISILLSLVWLAKNDMEQALTYLEKAISLAAPAGFLRVFLDEDPAMEDLLTNWLTARPQEKPDKEQMKVNAFVHQLLSAYQAEKESQTQKHPQNLVEDLSPREIEILQLIAQGLSNKEISGRLYLALNTIKGYNRNIFGKLGVQNRTEAASRARELGLL